MTDSPPPPRGRSLTTWSLAALGAGLALGALGHALGGEPFRWIAAATGPLGGLWMAALQATVLPLVVTYLLAAVVGARGHESVGALGGRAVLLFVAMLVAAGVFTLTAGPALIALYPVDAAMLASLKGTVVVPETARASAAAGGGSLGEWVAGLLPRNLFRAAVDGEILPLLAFTALFGVAVTRLPGEQREPLARVFQGLAAAMLTVVRWVLRFTPLGVFAFTYALALDSGGRAAGLLGAFVVFQSGLMLLFTAVLYPLTAAGGRVSIRDFARAVAPAQVVAVSTRSSVASLPALLEGARERLRLPPVATGFVLPLSNSLFKVNRTVSSTAKLLFLAHVYGLPLGAGTIAGFLVTVILLSFGEVGVPGGGTAFKTLPAYLAAGVPIEGIVILEAVDVIPDIFKTLLNVTGQMSAATLLSRSSRSVPVGEPA
ncbi:MAG TPA: cation:dicarboxylase symporter family transporter [Longimicrobiaceae bacterium]